MNCVRQFAFQKYSLAHCNAFELICSRYFQGRLTLTRSGRSQLPSLTYPAFHSPSPKLVVNFYNHVMTFIILAIKCYINVYKLMQLFISSSFVSHEVAVIDDKAKL
jgi:hypothetical protein